MASPYPQDGEEAVAPVEGGFTNQPGLTGNVQNVILTALLVFSISLITFVTIWVNHEEALRNPPAASSAGKDTSVTDWISAVGGAVGAVGTAGALWLGAVTFRRQVKDQHRSQASAVTVGCVRTVNFDEIGDRSVNYRYFIQNNSPLAIYNVLLYAGPHDLRTSSRQEVLVPGGEIEFHRSTSDFMAFAKFVDSAGVCWKRHGDGTLIEIQPVNGPWLTD
ncbi:hypothetical protein [Arthrobacter globiformis]|uniref:Uncharacterized protein n=1 Tax=Arthrobacter globiformis TaxID=1665 RepID=A0A328HIF8_ARTGO|nr:hypothetical protein [Arthrobacter globiformis]RAM37235.1 hypothetical protein DBZ45_10440 [Arthrobacter globiformis]